MKARVILVLLACTSATLAAQSQQTPTFRAGVELTALDVTVIDTGGRPITDLQPADFNVRIDGKNRPVDRAEWIPLTRPSTTPPPPPVPDGYSTNEGSTGGRLILIAIDQPNVRVDGALGIQATVGAFLDRLEPSDRVAAVALGGGPSTPFTTNRTVIKRAIAGMTGEMRLISEVSQYSVSASEALEIADGNPGAYQVVVTRECMASTTSLRFDPNCRPQIMADAQNIAQSLKQESDRTLSALYGLLSNLKKIEGPKTLVLVSEGFAMITPSSVLALGPIAAESRTTIYALKLDDRVFDTATKRPPPPGLGDRQLRYVGLDLLASISKGSVFEVVGLGSGAFQQLEREISGYYLLGVESLPSDKDGKNHSLNVQVRRGSVTVRARREFSNESSARAAAPNAIESISAALGSPLTATALPMHVATFSLRDDDPSKIQVLIHADIGKDYTSPQQVAVGYVISDTRGNIVLHQVGDGRLAPPTSLPAPLVYTFSARLAPGEYTLKFAAMEGSHVGSVEHPVHAGLVDAGPLKLSELVIGGPLDAKDLMRPTVGYDVNFGGVQGYIEAYGGENLLMRYEVAPGTDAPSLRSAVVPARSSGDGRSVFSYVIPVGDLQPGQYYLRATVSDPSGAKLKTVARAFRVFAPPPELTRAAARPTAPPAAARAAAAPANLPTVPLFRADDVTQGATLQRFRDLAEPAARADFDTGVAALASRDYAKAEVSFKNAQRASTALGNSTAPLAYLGATYAASGHYLEATNVWQSSLIDGSDQPEIYEWLLNALLQIRNLPQAKSILNEAVEKWPSDRRFEAPAAALQRLEGAK